LLAQREIAVSLPCMSGYRCQRSEHLHNRPQLALAAMMSAVPSLPNSPAELVAQPGVAAKTFEAQALRGEALAFEVRHCREQAEARLEVDVFRCLLVRTAVVPFGCSRRPRLGRQSLALLCDASSLPRRFARDRFVVVDPAPAISECVDASAAAVAAQGHAEHQQVREPRLPHSLARRV